jgi:hypothetical protein
VSLDRNIRWKRAQDMPPRKALGQVLRDFMGEAGAVRWHGDRWFMSFESPNSLALGRQSPLVEPMAALLAREPRERWIEVWPSEKLLVVDVMTRQQDEFTNALAVGIVEVIARWWKGEVETT